MNRLISDNTLAGRASFAYPRTCPAFLLPPVPSHLGGLLMFRRSDRKFGFTLIESVGGDRDHRDPHRPAPPRRPEGPRSRRPDEVLQQPQAVRAGACTATTTSTTPSPRAGQGGWGTNKGSWILYTLPFIEHDPLYKQVTGVPGFFDPAQNGMAAGAARRFPPEGLPFARCPSDGFETSDPKFTNYMGSMGPQCNPGQCGIDFDAVLQPADWGYTTSADHGDTTNSSADPRDLQPRRGRHHHGERDRRTVEHAHGRRDAARGVRGDAVRAGHRLGRRVRRHVLRQDDRPAELEDLQGDQPEPGPGLLDQLPRCAPGELHVELGDHVGVQVEPLGRRELRLRRRVGPLPPGQHRHQDVQPARLPQRRPGSPATTDRDRPRVPIRLRPARAGRLVRDRIRSTATRDPPSSGRRRFLVRHRCGGSP